MRQEESGGPSIRQQESGGARRSQEDSDELHLCVSWVVVRVLQLACTHDLTVTAAIPSASFL